MRQELTQVVQQNCLKKGTRGSLRNGTQRVLSYQKEAKKSNKNGCFFNISVANKTHGFVWFCSVFLRYFCLSKSNQKTPLDVCLFRFFETDEAITPLVCEVQKNRAFCFKKSGKQIAEPVKITIEKIRDAFTPPPRFSRVYGELRRQNKRGAVC